MQKQSEIKPVVWARCHICFHQTWGGECLGPGKRRGSERHSELQSPPSYFKMSCVWGDISFGVLRRNSSWVFVQSLRYKFEKGGKGCEVVEHDWTLCSEVCGAPGHRWI